MPVGATAAPLDARRMSGHLLAMTDASSNAQGSNAYEFTVSEISQAVKRSIEDQFGNVRVRGEVGRLSRPGSGHIYFDLKDENAVMSAVAWKGTASRWRFQPEQGLEVIVTGRLTTFPGQSKYQIIVETVEPAGLGALMALLEERRKKLAAEGLFDTGRKKDLPYLPRIIGVATSPSGAVIRDIIHRLEDRFPCHVIVWPCRVQGETCAHEIATAVRGFNSFAPDGPIPRPDLIIVARGGGSIEDLWGFNEEDVVRAVADSDIPVISAVGHETDTTLVDYVADRRAPTPTGAAEIAVPVRIELVAYVEDLQARQRGASRRNLSGLRDRLRAASGGLPRPAELLAIARQRLDHAGERLTGGLRNVGHRKRENLARAAGQLSPALLRQRANVHRDRLGDLSRRLQPAMQRNVADRRRAMPTLTVFSNALKASASQSRQRLDSLSLRTNPAIRRIVTDHRARLGAFEQMLNALSYKSVIARGFALVTDADGHLVRSAAALAPGDALSLEFADGKAGAVVSGSELPPKPKKPNPASEPKPRKQSEPGGQTSLF